MVITVYQLSTTNFPEEGYERFAGAYESASSAEYQVFNLFGLATADAIFAGASALTNKPAFHFTFDCYVYSDISQASNLQSYSGLPDKYRLGECQFGLGDVVSPGIYLNYLRQYIGSISFYAGTVSAPVLPPAIPIISIQANEIGYPFYPEIINFPRIHSGTFTDIRVSPESGVISKIYVDYGATAQYQRISPGTPGLPYIARP